MTVLSFPRRDGRSRRRPFGGRAGGDRRPARGNRAVSPGGLPVTRTPSPRWGAAGPDTQRWSDVRALPVAHPRLDGSACGSRGARRRRVARRGSGAGRPGHCSAQRPARWHDRRSRERGARPAAAARGRGADRPAGTAGRGGRGPAGADRRRGRGGRGGGRGGRRQRGARRLPAGGRQLRVGDLPGRRGGHAADAPALRRRPG
jgi:hypothetical protein